jgi:ribosomal-protein-alanine N-acetyltransferase
MKSLVHITAENISNYLDSILEIENLSFPSPWSPKLFRDELLNHASNFWGLVVDGVLVGYICFWMFASEIQVINFAIHPEHRGKRLGHGLLDEMIRSARHKGIQSIWLEVRPSNLIAQRLYSKAGFREIGRRPLYYRDTNEDAIVMSLGLSVKCIRPSDKAPHQWASN